ncbi:antitoxin Xre/MbcA/ParS toxin-binding domain-containing protein [Streptomyces sp. PR69]|uniref:antitoxin Xre/MbcA/ParS toxin-binding domain-containing protein n=1 Tax=Streptomyces sp. PR69 TaxID=2984950 RepID=UPI00226469C6|nr:antitoxin Xre/MbcA/ParS toxin-binding domain-containing protein [Streptomyces sp. PR69]
MTTHPHVASINLEHFGFNSSDLPDDNALQQQVKEIICLLQRKLYDQGVRQWMTGPNVRLNGATPRDVLRHDKDVEAVKEAAEAYLQGDYT